MFSREFSPRAILDYNGVLPNAALVSLEKSKRNARENMAFEPLMSPALQRTAFPNTTTGRQLFIKLSYLLRYLKNSLRQPTPRATSDRTR